MSASYPTSVVSLSTKIDGPGHTIAAAHMNAVQDEIVAIEDALKNGLAHDLTPSVAGADDLGTSALPWGNVHARGLDFDAAVELTVASGAVVVSQSYHKIDTESDAATDDLDTLTASGVTEGFVVVLRAENTARVVTVKDGTGNLLLSSDCALDATDRTLTLIYDGANWRELARSSADVRVLDRVTASVDVASSTSETTLYTKAIAGGTLGTNRKLRLTIIGDVLQNNGSQTVQVKAKYGSTVLGDTGAVSLAASSNRRGVQIVVDLMGRNATNAQSATVHVYYGGISSATNAGAMNSIGVHSFCSHVSVAEDSTGALNLAVTVQHSANSSSESLRLFGATLEYVD